MTPQKFQRMVLVFSGVYYMPIPVVYYFWLTWLVLCIWKIFKFLHLHIAIAKALWSSFLPSEFFKKYPGKIQFQAISDLFYARKPDYTFKFSGLLIQFFLENVKFRTLENLKVWMGHFFSHQFANPWIIVKKCLTSQNWWIF